MSSISLEDVILALPPTERKIVADLRFSLAEALRAKAELEKELLFARQRISELDAQVAALQNPVTPIPVPQMNLQELIAGIKAQHQAAIEAVRRRTNEIVHHLDDPGYDAALTLQTSVTRSLRPLPRNFEFIDLVEMKQQLTTEGHAPSSALQVPLLNEFVGHIDGVRQCSKDARHAFVFFDPIKNDVLRRLFDVCKNVEAKVGATSHLQLPSQTVFFDKSADDISTLRMREVAAHMSGIEACGEVFLRASRDVTQLDEASMTTKMLPNLMTEFDSVLQAMANDAENLQRNEVVLVEGGSMHIEAINAHRTTLVTQQENQSNTIAEKHREIDGYFDQMLKLLAHAEEAQRHVMEIVNAQSKTQVEVATCDHRIGQMRAAVESEVSKQQRFLEGTKFTTYLCNKSKDMFRRMLNNVEESIRSRRDLCERTKITSQEQLYTMAEVLHDIISKRVAFDNAAMRTDQGQLETANRTLMGLVHHPLEMERQMSVIRELTVSITSCKTRLTQATSDMTTLRQVVQKYGTIQFLKRDTNFLSIYDSVEKSSRLKERIDDAAQRVKYVSEMLVEVSDPETRQDYVVQQCLEALKVSASDVTDLTAARNKIEELDEPYRLQTSQRIRRHRRLIGHFLDELREGGNDLAQVEPLIEVNAMSLVEGLDVVLRALSNNDEPMPQRSLARQGTVYSRAGGGGGGGFGRDDDAGMRDVSVASSRPGSLAGKSFGRGAGGGVGRGDDMEGSMAPHHGSSQQYHSDPVAEVYENDEAHHTFARASSRIKLSHDSRRLTKPATGIELSNTSALGSVGFRIASGAHVYHIRIVENCSRLLVGFADWNLPLDGYCNSLKYHGCYYLHLGNGTLWAPDQGVERKAYTYEAIGTTAGGILKCVIDTNERTISFAWNDRNLGIAFRNVNLSRTLYPAFEVFSHGTVVEFTTMSTSETQQRRGGGGGFSADPGSPDFASP